jgi:hypothetical protein
MDHKGASHSVTYHRGVFLDMFFLFCTWTFTHSLRLNDSFRSTDWHHHINSNCTHVKCVSSMEIMVILHIVTTSDDDIIHNIKYSIGNMLRLVSLMKPVDQCFFCWCFLWLSAVIISVFCYFVVGMFTSLCIINMVCTGPVWVPRCYVIVNQI